ncbi:MAG: membrane dipeptidase [bacterium]
MIIKRIRKINSFVDIHNDTVLKLFLYKYSLQDGHKNLDIDRAKVLEANRSLNLISGNSQSDNNSQVAALFFAACTFPVSEQEASFGLFRQMMLCLNSEIKNNNDIFELAYSYKDYERIRAKGKTSVFTAIEGAYCITEPKHIEEVYDFGVRLITLTHNSSTNWAGSCVSFDGLSTLGVEMVKLMNARGIIIDLAHTSDQTIYDVAKITKKPIVFSHGGVRAISKSIRSLDDDVIKAVADTGGIIGVTFYPAQLVELKGNNKETFSVFIEKRDKIFDDKTLSPFDKLKLYNDLSFFEFPVPDAIPGLEAIFSNIDYIINLVGEDHVAIGSDLDGIRYSCKGLENISKVGKLIEIMQASGYSEARINKVMGNNALRILSEVLG